MAKKFTPEQWEKIDEVVKELGFDKKWEEKGIEKGKYEVAQKLILMGMELEKVAVATGLSEDELRKLVH